MINKLITRIKETNAPIVVGLDPMMKFVPEYIKKEWIISKMPLWFRSGYQAVPQKKKPIRLLPVLSDKASR